MEYLIKDSWKMATIKNNCFHLQIVPFEYNDGRKPRLPRKHSDNHQLQKDVEYYFTHVFKDVTSPVSTGKFRIELIVLCGQDRLGTADLDNYCKAILDGITKTRKIWNDDKQIDELIVRRVYVHSEKSKMDLKISNINIGEADGYR